MSAFSAGREESPRATQPMSLPIRIIKGEARSPEAAFATKIAKGYADAFGKAKEAGQR